jgi:hypothetical protein
MKWFFALLIFISLLKFSLGQTESITVYAGESKTINFTLINAANEKEAYTIFLSGPIAYFAERKVLIDVYPKFVELLPNESTKITLYIFASKDAKEISPNLFTLTISSKNQTIEKNIVIYVLRKFPVVISYVNLSNYSILPLESTKINVGIQNLKNEVTPNYKLLFIITKEGKEVFRKEVITDFIEANSKIEVSQIFNADKYQEAGVYDVFVRLETLKGEYIDEGKTKFEVKAIVKLPQEYTQKDVKYSLLSAKVFVRVKNEGNVFSDQFYIEERVPIFMKDFVKAYVPYSEQKIEGGFAVYRWLVKSLAPGESVIIEYEISLWQTWVGLVAIILAIIYFFKRSFRPSIIKTVKIEGKKLKVHIKVKNNSKSLMKNVEIIEEVLPMLKIESNIGLEFEEKKVGKKRYLVWKIDELKKDEEVIVGYIASSLVEIISLELPKTIVNYFDEKGRKKILQ